uniref:Uncharacterized protein n=1 Tax=Photinus pyralis TaxID=7054 RepID=A0A1Y1K9T1_PHOPY
MSELIPPASQNNDHGSIIEMDELQKLNVWGESQEVLEQQALKELEILNNATSATNGELEDGEIQSVELIKTATTSLNLDIKSYIKRQEELKKHHEYRRCRTVSDESKTASSTLPKSCTSTGTKRKAQHITVQKCKKPRNNREASCSGSEYEPSDDCLSSGMLSS